MGLFWVYFGMGVAVEPPPGTRFKASLDGVVDYRHPAPYNAPKGLGTRSF